MLLLLLLLLVQPELIDDDLEFLNSVVWPAAAGYGAKGIIYCTTSPLITPRAICGGSPKRVLELRMNDLGLSGLLPSLAPLSALKTLRVENNELKGKLAGLPPQLSYLAAHNNSFEGDFDATPLAATLTHVYVHLNALTLSLESFSTLNDAFANGGCSLTRTTDDTEQNCPARCAPRNRAPAADRATLPYICNESYSENPCLVSYLTAACPLVLQRMLDDERAIDAAAAAAASSAHASSAATALVALLVVAVILVFAAMTFAAGFILVRRRRRRRGGGSSGGGGGGGGSGIYGSGGGGNEVRRGSAKHSARQSRNASQRASARHSLTMNVAPVGMYAQLPTLDSDGRTYAKLRLAPGSSSTGSSGGGGGEYEHASALVTATGAAAARHYELASAAFENAGARGGYDAVSDPLASVAVGGAADYDRVGQNRLVYEQLAPDPRAATMMKR